jgi:hypothetical protein
MTTLSPAEEEVLGCLVALRAAPRRPVSVHSIYRRWVRTAPGGSGAEFGEAMKGLVQRGLIEAPGGDQAEAVSLTDAGFAFVRGVAGSDARGGGPVNIFNIGHIGTATGVGMFGDGANISSSPAPDGGLDPIREALERKERIAHGLEIDPHALQMGVGESGPFFNTEGGTPYKTRRTFNLKVENTDQRWAVTGCKIHVMRIDPPEYEGPWLLKGDFSLAAGDHVFVPLVAYGEARDQAKTPCGDTFMIIRVPEPSPKPSAKQPHIITLKATSLQTAPSEFQCRV